MLPCRLTTVAICHFVSRFSFSLQISHLQGTIEKYECENMGQGDKYDKLNSEYEKLKQMNQHQVAECSAFKTECHNLKQRVSDLENQLLNVQNENSSMKSEMKDHSSVKESEFKNVTAQLKTEKENFKLLEKKSSDEIKNLKSMLESREKEIDKIVMESKAKEEKFTATLKAITMEVQNLKESNVRKTNQDSQLKAKLEQEVGEMKGDIQTKEQEIVKLNKDLKFLRDSLTNAQTNTESLKAEIKNKDLTLAKQKELTENLQKDLDKQIKELSDSNERQEHRIKSVLTELESVKDKNKNLLLSLEKTERETQNTTVENKNLQEEKNSLEKKLLGLEKTKDCLTAQMNQIKIETEKLIQMNGSFKQETDELKNVLTGREKEIQDLKIELSHTIEKQQNSNVKLDKLLREFQESEEQVNYLKSELNSEKMKYEEETKSLNSVVSLNEERIKHFNEEGDRLKRELDDVKYSKELLNAKLKACENDMEQTNTEKAVLEKSLEIGEKEKEKLNTTLNTLSSEMKNVLNSKADTEKELEDVKFNHIVTQDKLRAAESNIEASNKKLLDTVEKAEKLNTEKQSLLITNTELLEQIETAKNEIRDKNIQQSKDQDLIATLKHELSRTKDQCDIMKVEEDERRTNFIKETEAYKDELEQKALLIEDLENQILHKVSDLEKVQELLADTSAKNSCMQSQIKTLQDQIEQLSLSEGSLANLKDKCEMEIKDLHRDLSNLKDEVHSIQTREKESNFELNRTIEELQNVVSGKDSEIEANKTELSHLSDKIQSLNIMLQKAESDVHEKEQIIKKQSSEVDELKTNLTETSLAMQNLSRDYEECSVQVTVLKDGLAENKSEFNQLKLQTDHEVEMLKTTIEKAENTIKSLQEENSHICIELQEISKKFEHTLASKNEIESEFQQLNKEKEIHARLISDLQAENDKHVCVIEALTYDVKVLKDSLHQKELDMSVVTNKLNDNIRELQANLEDKEREIESVSKNLADRTEMLDAKMLKIESLENENLEHIEQIKCLQNNKEELNFIINESNMCNEKLEMKCKELNTEIVNLKDKLSDMSNRESENYVKLNEQLLEIQTIADAKTCEIELLKAELSQKAESLLKKESEYEKIRSLNAEQESVINKIKEDSEELQFSLLNTKTGKEKVEDDLTCLKTEFQELQDKLNDQLVEETIKIARLNEEIKAAKSCAEDRDSDITKLTKEINHKAEELQEKNARIEKLMADKVELDSNVCKLNKIIEELEHSLLAVKSSEKNLQENINSYKTEVTELQDRLCEQQLEESVKLVNMKKELTDTQNIMALKVEELSKLKDEHISKESEIISLQNKVVQLSTEKQDLEVTKSTHEKTLDELRFEIEEADSKLKASCKVVSEKECEIVSLKDELSDEAMEHSVSIAKLNQQLKELQNIVEGKEVEITKFKEELTNLSSVHEKEQCLREDLEKEKSEQIVALNIVKEKLNLLELELEESRKTEEMHNANTEKMSAVIQSLKDEIHQKEQKSSEIILELQQGIAELNTVLEEKDHELKTINTEMCHLNEQMLKIQSSLDSVQKEKEELEYSKSEYLQKNGELNNILTGKNEELEKLRTEKEAADDALQKLQLCCAETQAERDDHKATIFSLSNEIDTLKLVIEEGKTAELKFVETVSDLQSSIKDLKEKLHNIETEESIQTAKLNQEIKELQNIKEVYETKLSQLENELMQNSDSMAKKTNKIESLEEERNSLQVTVHQQQTCIEELELNLSELKKVDITHLATIEEIKEELKNTKDKLSKQSIENSASVAGFETELEEKKTLHTEMEHKIYHLTEELNRKSQELTEKYSVCKEYEDKLKDLENNLNSCKSVEKELEFKLSEIKIKEGNQQTEIQKLLDLNTKYKNDLSENLNEFKYSESLLNKRIFDLENIVQEKDSSVVKLAEELSHYKQDNESLNAATVRLESELKEVNSKLLQKISDTEATACDMNYKVNQLQMELESARHQISELNTQLLNVISEKKQIDEMCQKKTSQLQVSQEDCEELQEEMQCMEKKLVHLEKDKANLEHGTQSLTERLTTLDMEKNNLQRVLEEKHNIIEGQLLEITDLRTRYDKQETKLSSILEEVKLAEESKRCAEEESKGLGNEIDILQFNNKEQVKELENKIISATKDYEMVESEKNILNKANRELAISLEELKNQNNVLMNELDVKKSECSSLDLKICNLKQECEEKEAKILEFTKNISDSETERMSVKQSLNESEFKCEKLYAELQMTQNKNADLLEEINNSVSKCDLLSVEKADVELKFSAAVGCTEQLRQTLEEKSFMVTELEERVAKLCSELKEIKDLSDKERLEEKSLKAEQELMLSELQNMMEGKNNEIANNVALQNQLKDEIIELKEKHNKTESCLADALSSLQQKETIIEEMKVTVDESLSKITLMEECIERKQSELHKLNDEVSVKSTQFTEEKHAGELELKELKSGLAMKSEEVETLRNEIISKTDKLKQAHYRIEELENKVNSNEVLVMKLEKDKCEVEQELSEKILLRDTDIKHLEEKVASQENDLENLKQEKNIVDQKLEAITSSYRNCENDLKTSEYENAQSKEKLSKVEREKEDLIKTVDQLSSDINALKTEKCTYEKKVGEAEYELLATQAFSQNLQSQLDEVDLGYKSLQDKVYNLTTQNESLASDLQQKNIDLQRIQLALEDKTVELNEISEKFTNENQDLRDKIYKLTNSLQNRDMDVKNLENEIENLKMEFKELTHIKEMISNKLDLLENKNFDLLQLQEKNQEQVSSLEEKIETLTKRNATLEIQENHFNIETEGLKEQLSQLKSILTETEEENVSLRCKNMEYSTEIQAEISKLKEQELICQNKTSVVQELEETVSKLKNEHIEIVEAKDCKIKELSDSVVSLTKELQSLMQQSSQKVAEVDGIAADLIEIQVQNDSLKMDNCLLQEKVSSLTQEIEVTNQRVQNSEAEMETMKLSLSELQDELNDSEKSRKETEANFCNLQTELEQLEKKIRNCTAEKEELENMVEYSAIENADKDETISQLKQNILDKQEFLLANQSKLDIVTNELNKVKQNLLEAEDSLNTTQKAKDAACAENKEKEGVLKTQKEKLESVHLREKEHLSTIDNLKDMMESLEFENNSLEKEKSALESKIAELNCSKMDLKEEIASLKEQIFKLEQEKKVLQSDIKQSFQKEIAHQDTVDAFNAELFELRDKYKESSSNENILRQEIKELQAKIETMEISFSSFDSQKSELHEVRGELQNLSRDKIGLQQKIATQDREKNDLLSQFLALEDQKDILDKENKELKFQVSTH